MGMMRFGSTGAIVAALTFSVTIGAGLGTAMAQNAVNNAAAPAAQAPAAQAPAAKAPAAKAKPKVKKVAAKAKPMKAAVPADAPKGRILIDNQRDAVLTEVILTSKSAAAAAPFVVAHGLAAHTRLVVPLPKGGGCVYDVEGTFDDTATVEQSSSDLCNDRALHLTE